MLRSIVLALAGVGLGMLSTSCYVTSINSITEQPSVEKMNQLLGMWEGLPTEKDDDAQKGYLLIMKAKGDQLHLVVMENHYEYSESYLGFISTVNGHMFLNVKALRENSKQQNIVKDKNYTLLYVDFKKNTLSMSLLNEELIKEKIVQKKIEGKVSKYKTQLTDSSENIESLIKQTKLKVLLDKQPLYKAKKVRKLPESP